MKQESINQTKIELRNADNDIYKLKFVNLIMSVSNYSVKELYSIYTEISEGNSCTIQINITDFEVCNDFVLSLLEMGVSIGYTSFHEEGDDGGMQISQEDN